MRFWRDIRSGGLPFAGGLLIILLLGVVDVLSGLELSFSIFYLVPITWLTWTCGLLPGILASLLAAIVWLGAEFVGGQFYHLPWAPYWNMSVRLGLFLLMAVLLDNFKTNLERRRLLERIFFHDLLNLTGSLRGFAELLQEENLPERREVVHLLGEATERVIDEIETQRILTSAESGDLAVEMEPLRSRPLLDSLLAIYRHHHCAEGRTLIVADSAEDLLLQSDPALLTRILGNLIKNALEATPPGGTVTVGCQSSVSGVVFHVANPGVIPETLRTALFQNGLSTKGRGRGLGLKSIRTLVDALGGEVDFVSTIEQGTSFSVKLPAS